MVHLGMARRIRHMGMKVFVLILGVLVGIELALAADFPTKVVSIIVPMAPGGGIDVQARLLAKGLAQRLGKPVVVDNRPGAGGRIGASLAARAAADGHKLFLGSLTTLVIEPVLRTNVGYDPQRDFAPVTLVSEEPFLLVVSSSLPVKSVPELVVYARSHQLTYASWGPGSSAHLLGEMFKAATQADILHVPYKGSAPAVMDVIGGQVSMMFANALTAVPHIRSGKLRALAVPGPKRVGVLPEVPTLTESGVSGVDLKLWYGFVVPVKTPPEIVARLHKELSELVKGAEFRTYVESLGAEAVSSSPKEMSHRIQSDSEAIRRLAKEINFRVDD